MNEDPLPTEVTIDQGNLIRGVIIFGQKSSQHRSFDARQLSCVFQDMTPPKSILRKSTDMPKPIPACKVQEGSCADDLQYRELRSYRGSGLVKFVLWISINFKETYDTCGNET